MSSKDKSGGKREPQPRPSPRPQREERDFPVNDTFRKNDLRDEEAPPPPPPPPPKEE